MSLHLGLMVILKKETSPSPQHIVFTTASLVLPVKVLSNRH